MGTYASAAYDVEIELGRPWPRFWARMFDIIVYGLPAAFLLALAFPTLFTEVIKSGGSGGSSLFGMVVLPLIMIIDAIVISQFGSSPGKAIAGLYVSDLNENRLTIEKSLKRNLHVYVGGLVLGIPLLCLAGYIKAYNDVKQTGLTAWDQSTETRVFSTSENSARTFLIGALAVVSIIASSALAAAR